MLRDATACIAANLEWRRGHSAVGNVKNRRGSVGYSFDSPPSLLSHILKVEEHLGLGAGWRDYVVEHLTALDRADIARVRRAPARWYRPRLEVLLGTLRVVRANRAGCSLVTISRAAAKRIAGGRQPKWLKERARNVSSDKRRKKRAAYRVMLDAAAGAGWLDQVGSYRVGVHGRVFRFWLPGDPPLVPEDEDHFKSTKRTGSR